MGNKSAKRTSGFLGTSALTRPLFALGAATALFGAGPAHAIDANTLPQNPNVVGGKDSFAQSGNTLNVNQSTKRTVIDWRSFDIGSKAQVNFNQPGTSAIAVNRVNSSANPTQIEGGLHANGQVWILNPNGVFFGKTAHVDAAGIVASTANIDTNAFMAGSNKLQMTGADHGAVENQGNISVGQAGLAAFVAPSVRNSGTINATVGRVALAAGTTYTLDLAGDHLVELGLGSVKAVVDNSGKIVNPGGTIALTAKAASQVVSSVVNVSGTVSASSVTNSGGTITLGGDNVTTTSTAQLSADAGTNGNGGTITSVADNQGNYAGSFSAKGGSQSGNGGKVETSGKTVVIDPKAKIVASAAHGANGQWLLDPVDLNIISGSDDGVVSGSSVTNGTIQDTLNNNTDLTLSTSQGSGGNGDISLQTAINATGTGALTLTGRHLSAANSSDVINIGGTLTLNVNAVNNTANPTGSWISDALGMVGTVNGGTTVNVGAGTYNENIAITKSNVSLLSTGGRDVTTIAGQGNTATGTITVGANANNFTLGGIGHGFTVIGIGTANWAQEPAAVRFVANNSGSKIIGNRITANGQYGLLTNSSLTITNLVIDSNIFDGKTFTGDTPGGWGFTGSSTDESGVNGQTNQFSFPNTPRQLVTLNSGNGVQFTNNQVTGTAGGINASGVEQGNTLVTIDANNAVITGNTFAGTTTRYGAQLRARGTTVNISDNTFDSAGLGLNAVVIEYKGQIFTGNTGDAPTDLTSMMAANTFTGRAVWDSQAAARLPATTAYDVGVSIASAVASAAAGDTINIEAGTYSISSGIVIGTDGITLQGVDGAKIAASGTSNIDAITINSDDVTVKDLEIDLDPTGSNSINGVVIAGSADDATVSGLTIRGEVATTRNGYIDYAFGGANSRGIVVKSDASGFSITGNDIRNVRTGILVDGALVNTGIPGASTNSGDITDNLIDNTKGALLINYSQGAGINISGNHQATYGNEWGEIWDLQGAHTGAASDSVQAALLAASVANNGWTVEDQAYASSNRTAVTVAATATNANGNPADSNQGSYRSPLATIQAGVNAVVAGGTVNVLGGDYTMNTQLNIGKSLSLIGAGVGVTNITSNSTGYGISVTADGVSLKDFTYHGPTYTGPTGKASTYGIKVSTENTASLMHDFDIENVTIDQGYRTGLDLNGVVGATIKNVNVSNIVNGNGIGLTNSADVTITGSTTADNAWGGLALYQNDKYAQQLTGITVDGTNTFNEANGIYAQNQSLVGTEIGSIDLTGQDIQYIAQLTTPATSGDGTYTFFQKTEQGAVDLAVAFDTRYGVTAADVQGYAGTDLDGNNIFYVGTSGGSAMSIDAAIDAASSGATINVEDGDYTLASELDIDRSLSLVGAGVGSTNITSNSTGYGIYVTADDVSLSGFTYNAPTAVGATYGIKVEPGTNVASDRVTGFNIDHVTINGGYRTGLDLNGVDGATIDSVSVSNVVHGNGIALTDSANVTLTNDTTTNNAWGGLALYQTNTAYDQQVNNIVVDGTNTFNDTIPVYAEDQSDGVGANGHPSVVGGSGLDFGTITLAGFDYVVQSPNNASDVYSWFQKTKQAAFDFATNASLSNNNVNLPTATVQGYDGSGVNGDNVFYVGTGSNSVAMSIGSAVSQATTGGTVNVGAGTYAEDVAVGAQLSFNFGGSGVTVNSLTVGSGGAGSSLSGDLTATGAIALNGATTVNGNLKAASFASNATLAMTGNLTTSGAASLGGASTVKGNIQAASFTSNGTLALTGDLTTSGAAALNGASSVTGDVTAASFTSGSTLALVGDLTATNGVTFGGATTVTGDIAAKTFTSNGTLALNGDLSASGAALFSGASSVNGNVTAGSITANNAFALNGGATASGAVALNGATTLAGNVTGGSIALGATTLGSNVTLDTSAANGAIKVASVNGSTAGGQSLAVKAGTGTVSLGNVGATTALASLTDASATTLTGATYNAGGFLFGGDVTLTAATTTLSTGGGDITFTGDIFGTADGAQSLTLNAGPGTGSPSANGNITLDNAGTSAIWLGDVTVSGNNFTADTVYVGGNYTSTLTGNQVFAADTLHTRGNVDSTVGGDASGHIDAAGDVNINAGGDVSGTIGGNNVTLTGDDVNANVTAQSNASVTGNTVEGSYAADTVGIVAHDNVDAAVNATNFQLVAAGGSVDGTWTNYTITGSGIVYLNGDPQIGVNPSQLVVEGFTLPAGTTIGANGQLILPQGVLLGLLSPGGGKPKMILVHTVQELGQLLADGYSVIVIDLSGKDKDKPIQLASN